MQLPQERLPFRIKFTRVDSTQTRIEVDFNLHQGTSDFDLYANQFRDRATIVTTWSEALWHIVKALLAANDTGVETIKVKTTVMFLFHVSFLEEHEIAERVLVALRNEGFEPIDVAAEERHFQDEMDDAMDEFRAQQPSWWHRFWVGCKRWSGFS